MAVKERRSRKLIFWQRFEKVDLRGWQDKEYMQGTIGYKTIAHCNLEVKYVQVIEEARRKYKHKNAYWWK